MSALFRIAMLIAVGGMLTGPSDVVAKDDKTQELARMTAVTLNYCRASFHRIRKYQTKRVIFEEKEKILNNLNLDGIANEEVIQLYSSVLDEMNQIDIAEREREVYQEKYKKSLDRRIGSTLFILSAQLATASLEGMVRTGVNSWLDYRDLAWTRELDRWKVEKSRIQAVVTKSSRFLDTFWKLAQEYEIPDRWLIRGTDIDQLMSATKERDLSKRLRILNRMKPYMECYPPYWYYLARTQQGLGKMIDASKTYTELDRVADGHFRRDDMLAASLANLAMIQLHLGESGAVDAAQKALAKSSAVWEVNLMCAQVLEQNNQIADAEDAILRNLDVDLERSSSSVALVGLLYRQDETTRLAETLNDKEILAALPMLSLVQCMQKLGPQRTPPAVAMQIRKSLRIAIEPRFGMDDLIIACAPGWQPQFASVSAVTGRRVRLQKPERTMHASGELMLRFRRAVEGNGFQGGNSLAGTVLEFTYPDPTGGSNPPRLNVRLGQPLPKTGSHAAAPWWTAASPNEVTMGATRISLMPGETKPANRRIASPPRSPNPLRPNPGTGRGPRNPIFPTRPPAGRTAAGGTTVNPDGRPGTLPKPPEQLRVNPREDRTIPKATILGVRAAPAATSEPEPSVPPPPEE